MDISEREATTRYAVNMIDSYLGRKEYASALLLSSIYAYIRLKSLLTDRLNPSKERWKKISKTPLSFNIAVNLCEDLEILSAPVSRDLRNLWEKRCSIAHESKLWKELSEEDIKKIRHLCEFAKSFLEETKSKS